MQWISIKDYLPENKKGVIASNGDLVGELYFNYDKFNHPYDCEMDVYDIEFIESVTHWMPLPEPPKEDN